MKKRIISILSVLLLLTLCLSMTGCELSPVSAGGKCYSAHSKLISIEGEDDLYYYSTTRIVYIVFNEYETRAGYGYMSPYYSENGKLCIYDCNTKQIVELN